jgi:transcription-repair coupling factor (superfamily II helicase)
MITQYTVSSCKLLIVQVFVNILMSTGTSNRYYGFHDSTLGFSLALLASGGDLGDYCASAAQTPLDVQGINFNSNSERALVCVVPERKTAENIIADLSFLMGSAEISKRVYSFLPWEVLPFEALSPAQEVSAERLDTLSSLLRERGQIVITTPAALMQRIVTPAVLEQSSFELQIGKELARDTLVAQLDKAGYVRTSIVEECGQIAVRGSVVDFFPPGCAHPVRVELFGSEIDSLRFFDSATQRSVERIPSFSVVPVSEFLRAGVVDSLGGVNTAVGKLRERAENLSLAGRHIASFVEALETGTLHPGIEHLYPLLSSQTASFLDYVPSDAQVVVYDSPAVQRAADEFEALLEQRAEYAEKDAEIYPEVAAAYQSTKLLEDSLDARADAYFDQLEMIGSTSLGDSDTAKKRLSIAANSDLHKELQLAKHSELPVASLANVMLQRAQRGFHVAVVVGQESRARRLQHLLEPYSIECVVHEDLSLLDWAKTLPAKPAGRQISILMGALQAGFVVPQWNVALFGEGEIFPQAGARRARARASSSVRRFLGSVAQLSENDFVVHVEHGVGIYRGLREISVEGKIGDFLYLEYAGEARLFIPVEDIGKVQKYVGAEGKKPALTKLGGNAWEKSKAKVKLSVAELAGELISLYASRSVVEGHSFGELDSADQDFADTFEYAETPDQQKAIDDVLGDMAKLQPMDRLVCGDVGYGKTEIAIRAAFKAVSGGKQVALMVPTTVLADQHYVNLKERFANYPINVACVSRFSSTKQNKETLENLSRGKVDIIIGTHRLLQKDVYFKDIGLIIIDEEHRFGVAHKEKLKRFRQEVDVLTLTATPIPRTLHMSLLGIRDLSVIETAPSDRHVTRTYLAPYNNDIVREAIVRELGRSGQVFYIHNRVQNIGLIADELSELVPEARVEFAHGQMKDKELEEIMHRFLSHEIDVLVSTTIVESGLDIPNANTIIIRKADAFGLAELYQLRGRVGRSSRRAYAYLMISDPKKLGPDAKKRLQVLQSLDDLGVGFRLALQDMEIRGAGNLLGKDQSGQVSAVGFELYTRILKEAVEERRKVEQPVEETGLRYPNVDPEVNIGFPAHIPAHYVPDVGERLIIYQRLVELRDEVHGRSLAEEIEDRFGGMPQEVELLIESMLFRNFLRRCGILSASFRQGGLVFSFHRDMPLDPDKIISVVGASEGALRLLPSMAVRIGFDDQKGVTPGDLHKALAKVVREFGLEPLAVAPSSMEV